MLWVIKTGEEHVNYFRSKNIQNRLRLVTEWYYKEKNYFKSIIWSDESKALLFEKVYRCWEDGLRYDIKNQKPIVNLINNSIMVRGCFSVKSVENINIIEGKMDSLEYTTILNDNLFKSAVDSSFKFFNSTR